MRQVNPPNHDNLILSCICSVSIVLAYQPNDVDEQEIVGPLDRGRSVACLAQDPDTQADCFRSLAESAYTSALGLHGHKRYDVGINVVQRAINMTQLALDTLVDKTRLKTSRSWQDLVIRKHTRYDVLSACLFGIDSREVSQH